MGGDAREGEGKGGDSNSIDILVLVFVLSLECKSKKKKKVLRQIKLIFWYSRRRPMCLSLTKEGEYQKGLDLSIINNYIPTRMSSEVGML